MPPIHRRTALKLLGAAAVSTAATGSATASAGQADDEDEDEEDDAGGDRQVVGEIFKLGHTLGSDPPGGYAEEDVRVDGEMALLSSFLGEGGSFLYDIRNPTDPTEVHRLRSAPDVRNADCAFDPREGLYYRSQEPNEEGATLEGVEVVDYGFQRGSVERPVIVSKVPNGPTHNLFPHPDPETAVLYTTHEEMTMKAWDVSDPAAPEELFEGIAGGSAHDVVVDPDEEVLYFAGEVPVDEDGNVDERESGGHHDESGDDEDEDRGRFFSYAFFDVSDPGAPELLGGLDPTEHTSLEEAGMDGAGFEHGGGHYADYDPRRAIAYVSDETGRGVPAGKWALDVGWKDGSFEDPVPLGFTRSPNAELQDETDELFDWTTHNHDVIPKPDATLLVSGDYHEGTVVYDFTDPENPAPSDQYRTDDGADEADGPLFFPEGDSPPMAWGANYNEERDLTVTSDMWTGLYVFTVTPTVNEDDGDSEGDGDTEADGEDGEDGSDGDGENGGENDDGGDEDDHDDENGDSGSGSGG